MYDWGLLFAFMGLYFYLVKKLKLISSLFFSLAVISQQWLLMVILAVFLHEWQQCIEGKLTRSELVREAIIQGVFLLPAIILFVRWGGLVHPNFRSHALVPGFWHLGAILSMTGFLLLLPMLMQWRSFIKGEFLPLLFLLPMFWLTVPGFQRLSNLTHISGYFPHMLLKLEQLLHVPYRLSMFVFAVFGMLVLVAIMKKVKIPGNRILAYSILGLFAALTASVRLTIGHIHMVVPLIVLLFHSEISDLKKLKFVMVAQYLFVCIVYLVDLIFFKARGVLL